MNINTINQVKNITSEINAYTSAKKPWWGKRYLLISGSGEHTRITFKNLSLFGRIWFHISKYFGASSLRIDNPRLKEVMEAAAKNITSSIPEQKDLHKKIKLIYQKIFHQPLPFDAPNSPTNYDIKKSVHHNYNKRIDTLKNTHKLTGKEAYLAKKLFISCFDEQNIPNSFKDFETALNQSHISSATKKTELFNSFKRACNIAIFHATEHAVQHGYQINGHAIHVGQPQGAIPHHYSSNNPIQKPNVGHQTQIEVLQMDSFDAAQLLIQQNLRPAVLNMANQKKRGGGVTNGASAQEESLCRRSNLYQSLTPSLYPFPDHTSLISQGISVIRNSDFSLCKPFTVDIISNAALHLSAANPTPPTTYYSQDLPNRIRSICDAALKNGNNAIVLGAHGCGAFNNDPQIVSNLFKQILQNEYSGCFERIVFAVINDKNGTSNFSIFNNILNGVVV